MFEQRVWPFMFNHLWIIRWCFFFGLISTINRYRCNRCPNRIEWGQFQAARAIRNEHRWNIWRVNNDVGLKIKSFKISGTLIQFAYGEKFTLSLTLRLADTQLSCNAI